MQFYVIEDTVYLHNALYVYDLQTHASMYTSKLAPDWLSRFKALALSVAV